MKAQAISLLVLAATLSVARAASGSQKQASDLADAVQSSYDGPVVVATSTQVQATSVVEQAKPAPVVQKPLLDFIGSTPQLAEFASGLKATGLDLTVAQMLENGTVIAPTNFAFSDLFAALNVTSADQIPLPLLSEVLRYHLLPETYKSADLVDGAVLTTLLKGESIKVEKDGSTITFVPSSSITTAPVLIPDVTIPGSNAVIYIVDGVLLPDLAA